MKIFPMRILITLICISMRQRKHTKEALLPVVIISTNYTDLLRNLGLRINGGNHRLITMRIKEYGIDTSHFTGNAWNKGKTKKNDDSLRRQSITSSTPNEQIFCINSGYNSSRIYDRLIEMGWKEECSVCGIKEWMEKSIRFHVDHMNGNHTDNRFENLRIICPNCHQQTNTWGAKNKKKACLF